MMFLVIAAVSFLFDIATGPAMTDTLPVGEVVNVLLGKPEVDEMNRLIVMDLRLPIAVMAWWSARLWVSAARKFKRC